jgi:fibro-slime domain-containing protein
VGCGNGKLDPGLDEACDDGNAVSGDGCAADCRNIERDFGCLAPGVPCVSLVQCGDGKLMGAETCDDGNARAGDGCSAECAVEAGWECFRAGSACVARCGDARLIGDEQCDPPSVGAGCTAECRLEPGYACEPPPPTPIPSNPARCHRTVCGDSTLEGGEACDDGNVIDGDGCSASCTLEPSCKGGTCVSICGDRIKLQPEECDDGNLTAGDGCSPACAVERGFACGDASSRPPDALNLAATYRDFIAFPTGGAARHPDFEATWEGSDVTSGLVAATLGGDGIPALDGRCSDAQPATVLDATLCPYGQMATTQANFSAWYRDTAGVNRSVPGALLLSRAGNGSYTFDSGNGGFYPVDDQGFVAAPVSEGTTLADAVVNDGQLHNFGFTTELRYFFQYVGGEVLTFSGDDDLWVFVNGRLALDVGGLHPRTARTLDVDTSAAALGLARGGVYEIALFHAERHSAASNFRLTLTGFAPIHSTCAPVCGDGVVAASEQCDSGRALNDGRYNGCTADCRRGPACGDGVVQSPDEACDDGLNVTPYAKGGAPSCAPGCVPAARCGDGVLDSLFGEECDNGGAPGGGCSLDCRLAARCGDGVVQPELGEECDDGNTLSGDACTFACRRSIR